MIYTFRLSDLSPWSYGAMVPALALVELTGFRWIFSLDYDPSRKQGTDSIRLRASARIIEVTFMIGSALILVAAVYQYERDLGKAIGEAVFGLAFGLIAGVAFNTHLWLDDDGMHYRQWVGKVQYVPWKDLDHYEIQRRSGSGGGQTFYNFISTDGTSLSISRSNYDVTSLLQKIGTHTDIHERPYKARNWFSD